MSEILHQLGIDWKLLASQAVNFLVLLVALNYLVYQPLLKIMRERRKKIEFGLQGAAEAEKRLAEIDSLKQERLALADKQAVAIINQAEGTAKESAAEIMTQAEIKANRTLEQALAEMVKREAEEMNRLAKEGAGLIREALAKAVMANPDQIDELLVNQAAGIMAKEIKSWPIFPAILPKAWSI